MPHILVKTAMQAVCNRVWSYVWHVLSAWNTTGEGIHSPYLFYIVRFLMHDRNAYYCFADIERRRESLRHSNEILNVVDFGSSGSPEGKHIQRKVCDIAQTHLESNRVGQLLFRLADYLGKEKRKRLNIIELGTSLGITTAYLASASSRNNIVTLEGSGAVAEVAKRQWKMLGIYNINCVVGRIEDTLKKSVGNEPLDLVFVDANHTYRATKEYADYLLPRMDEKGILVVDDIHHSEEMERAWEELKNDVRVTTSMDLWYVGLLFVDKHYLKRHYKILL